MTPTTTNPAPGSRRVVIIAATIALVVGLFIFSGLGSQDAAVSVMTALDRLIVGCAAPAAYLLAGVGLGRLFRPLFKSAADPLALQVASGLAALLWLSHLLGWLGLFGGAPGPTIAIAPIALGCLLALDQLVRRLKGRGIEITFSPLAPLSALGIALLLVAACNPPGALWSSEFGGYDVLEYHLQLPQEWLAQGRIAPLTHNVYSFLPSYLESAYTHLGAMTLAPRPDASGAPWGLAAGEGYRLISCQLLHAAFAITAAWLTARLVRQIVPPTAAPRLSDSPALTEPRSVPQGPRDLAPPLAFALVLLTPWTIVTGSMAYNEMAMLALFAGAILAAIDPGLSDARGSLLTGLLIGAAVSVKPTALLLCAWPTAILLATRLVTSLPDYSVRRIGALTLPGAAAGLLMLAPWLVRNYLAAHNPVFPFGAGVFGTAHWTAEQVTMYAAAHRFQGGFLERIALTILPDPHPTQPNVSAHRGTMHPQFGLLFPFTLLAVLALLQSRVTGKPRSGQGLAAVLAACLLVQLGFWLTATHIQSRFLIPLIVPAAALIALAAPRLTRTLAPAASVALLGLLPLTQLAYSAWIFTHEHSGQPNEMLIGGPGLQTGQMVRELPEAEQRAWIGRATPKLFVNLALPARSNVYLLGDATPLYITRPTIYNTTYDTWPIHGDPATWSRSLHDLHIDFVLVNLGEIGRLGRSGWLPPDISLDKVKDWLQHDTDLVHAWEKDGVYLVHPTEPAK